MNIQINYGYRDAANYKQFGEVVFSNKKSISLELISQQIESRLIEGLWFVASNWKLPDLYRNPFDPAIDHGWHEFECVEETDIAATIGIDIADWLDLVTVSSF